MIIIQHKERLINDPVVELVHLLGADIIRRPMYNIINVCAADAWS